MAQHIIDSHTYVIRVFYFKKKTHHSSVLEKRQYMVVFSCVSLGSKTVIKRVKNINQRKRSKKSKPLILKIYTLIVNLSETRENDLKER